MADATFQRTFAGGELAPALHARADQVKYVTGLAACQNFMVLRSGGVANRPGFRFVKACATTSISVRLAKYVADTVGESVLLEIGNGYIRFFKQGAAVELTGVAAYNGGTSYVIGDIVSSGGVNYYCKAAVTGVAPPNATYWYPMPGALLEVPSPFGTSLCNVSQSGVTLTLTSRAGVVPPHELIYVSLTRWVIRQVTTSPSISAPTTIIVTPGGAGDLTRSYIVTAGKAETYEESLPSSATTQANVAEPTPEAPIVVQWTGAAGAAEYYVYCDPYGNGTYGFIGTATGLTSFRDVGFTPDFAVTPPIARTLFNSLTNYPRRSATYQQRRFFTNSLAEPDAIYGSRVGFVSNFGISSPLQDDDAITMKIAGQQANPVRHLLGLRSLIALTDGGAWPIGEPNIPLSPSYLPANQQSFVGVSDVDPVVVGNAILYVQARGSILRDLQFDQQVEGLGGRDLTVFASHLVDGYTLDEIDYQHVPHSIVWCVRSDGVLLGLTYLRDQEIAAWHRHTTQASGRIEHVCVVPENQEDVVYVIVRRTINGAFVRYIERLEERHIETLATDAFFVDSGLTYSGAPADVIAGLEHLEGEVVAVLADGNVLYDGDPAGLEAESFRVQAGQITLAAEYSVVHVGLPIRFAEVETLDLDVQSTSIRDKKKRVGSVALLIDGSARTFLAGPTRDDLRPYNMGENEGSDASEMFTGRAEQVITATFNHAGRVVIRQTDPLPLTILGILPNVEMGG